MDPIAILLGAVGSMLKLFLHTPAFWLIALMFLAVVICRLPVVKGWIGEWMVVIQRRLRLPKGEYAMVPNVTIPDGLGGTTQIDHVIVSRHGVFVVETKNWKGWIFGSEDDREWTQKFRGGHSQKVPNPLRQNFKHTETLAGILGLPREKVISCIAFVGDCTLKTRDRLPPNVRTNAGWVSFVKGHRTQVLTNADVAAVLERIEEARLAPGFKTHREHVRYVQRMKRQAAVAPAEDALIPDAPPVAKAAAPPIFGQVAPASPAAPLAEGSVCPRCGGTLVARTARQGPNAGKRFLGCSNFPKCRFVG